MQTRNWFKNFVSTLVALGLLLQPFAPLLALTARAGTRQQTDDEPFKDWTTAAANFDSAPAALANPLTISRAQSSYQAGGDLTVTYSVQNNLSATHLPDIAAGLTVTDTVAALSGYDPLDDPNTLRGVVVSAELANGAAFLDASLWPDNDGGQLLFQLGNIAPSASAAFTITLSAPASAADFIELDSGVTAYATLKGRMTTAVAPPIRLAPDGFTNWLVATPDAARDDQAMLYQLADLSDDPFALFEFVQGLGYEAYDGSLRGTRGTLWSEAGNSADQSSLLIAMLRAAGYPARYRHGALPQADAQGIIASMFPTPAAIRGHVPNTAAVGDPVNDPSLLALAQDHWWVQAYLPGSGWTDLDPTIAAAAPGDVFAAPVGDGTDQIAELPDAVRHKLSFTLDAEQYSAFPLGGLNLQRSTVLTAVIPTAQTAGLPVNIAFIVESDIQNGVFANAQHTYTPYLAYGGSADTIFGTPIQDLLTSFPLATYFTTGIWLEVTSTAPDGRSNTYRRTIKDLVGPDLRLGGSAQLPPRDESPLLSSSDLIQVQPIPHSAYPTAQADRALHAVFQQVPALVAAYDAFGTLTADPTNLDVITAFVEEELPALTGTQFAQLDLISAMFQYLSTWDGKPFSAETMFVKSYPDRPKLILSSQVAAEDGALQTSFELLNIAEFAVPYPGQNLEAVQSANFLRTSAEKGMEYEMLSLLLPGEVHSAVRTLLAAAEQGIPTLFIVAENLAELDDLAIPDDTKAHIANHAATGALVVVPEQMVPMPYGEDIGFMVIAPDGNASYVNADGYTAAEGLAYAIQYKEVIATALVQGSGLGFVGGAIAYYFSFFAEVFTALLTPISSADGPGLVGAASGQIAGASAKATILGLIAAASAALPLAINSCSLSSNIGACTAGAVAAYGSVVAALVAALAGGALDPSLTDFWVSALPLPEPAGVSTTTLTTAPTLSGPVNFNVSAAHHWSSSANLASDWSSSHAQAAPFAELTAVSAELSQNGVLLGSGSLLAENGRAQFSGSAQQWSLTANGAASSYAPATDGLALTQVGAYAAATNASGAALVSSYATVNNGGPYTGELDAVFNSDVALTGTGAAPAPIFGTAHTITLQQGQVMVSDIDSGTVTVGGTTVPSLQTFALGNVNGDLTLSDGGDLDQIALSGAADFFALTATPATANAAVNDGIVIAPSLLTNYSDTYTLTLSVPEGWAAEMVAGTAVVTPTAKAAIGSASVLLTAQSTEYPALFASAVVELNLAANQAVNVTVTPDPLIAVPMGIVQGSAYDILLTLNHAGDGQAEVPGAAFNVTVRNDSTTAATFDVDVAGLPAGWAVWSGGSDTQTSVTLDAGAQQTIGLYVVPPAGPLPAPGTNYPFTVTATDGSVADSDGDAFTMPALPFPYLTVDPLAQTVLPGAPVTVTLALENVGNGAASFPVTVTLRGEHFSTAVISPTVLLSAAVLDTGSLAPGAIFNSDMVVDTAAALPGTVYFVEARSTGGEFAPMALAAVQFTSLLALPMLETATCQPEPAQTATINLVNAFMAVESSCAEGDCLLQPRLDLLNAIDSFLASVAAAGFSGDSGPIAAARDEVANATANADLLAALADLSPAVTTVGTDLCEISQHRVDGRFTPYVDAILLGDAANFTLDVTNLGTLTTTYTITVTGLPDGDQLFNENIAPGVTVNLPVNSTPAALGVFDLAAEIVATAPDVQVDVRDTAVARLNVVEKFVQVTQVTADPPFVETGVSSTTLQVEVANFAGVGLDSVAETVVFAADGSQQFSTTVPLTLLAGNPRVYDLTSIDTSGWPAGVYTATVNLVDGGSSPIPDGSGYGYFTVGQALELSQAVSPEIVALGTVTVTTIITSEIHGPLPPINDPFSTTLYDTPLTETDLAYLNRTETENLTDLPAEQEESPIANSSPLTPFYTDGEETADFSPITHLNFPPTFVRAEQDDPAWSTTGTWTNVTLQRASGGSYWREATAGSTAALTFDGAWISLGFIADRFSGYAEIFVDGSSEGIIDLYRNEEAPVSYLFDGLSAGTHTLIIDVQGSANPFASSTRVQLDYADYGDGSALPDGDFEQDDQRLIKSSGWFTTTYAGAGGGSYIGSSLGTAWFPFSGDSFSLHTIAYSSAGKARLFVDGIYLDTVDMFAPIFASAGITRTFSYEGLGAGPHTLQVVTYENATTIDKVTAPGTAPFIDPNPPISGITRFEADHPSVLYNSVPYTQTATSWVRVANIFANRASAGEYVYSAAANDTTSFDFAGDWLGVGFAVDRFGGQAEIAIDGQLVQTVDLYGRYEDTASFYFRDLGPGPHTVTVTVLGTSHPNASASRVYLDFFDVWDGGSLADGTFEEDDGRLFYGSGWTSTTAAAASGGAYGAIGNSGDSTVWFPFSGDSVTYQGWSSLNYDQIEIRLNGESQGKFSLYTYDGGPLTYSFADLGPGPHVMEVRQYRDTATVDAFITPAVEPAYEAPAPSAIVRFEEDHPAMRYNGDPFSQSDQSWVLEGSFNPWRSSGGNNMTTSTAGDAWSLDFDGQWLNIGFRSAATSGTVEIFIDGVSQGNFDTTNGTNGVVNVTFGDLAPGSHTVAVVVVSGTVLPDYMDVWDGLSLDAGWYNADLEDADGRFHFSNRDWWQRIDNNYAHEGDYLSSFVNSDNNIWFTFFGADLTVLGHHRAGTQLEIVIDGVNQGVFDMTPPFSEQAYALHFTGLGDGAHVVQVIVDGNQPRIDAFEVDPDGSYSYTPEITWYDTAPATVSSNPGFANIGLLSSIAIGDLDGDGLVELVAPSTNGTLYVYRGDGQDAGGGSPLLWSTDVVGVAAEPALADINDDGRAEIIVSGFNGTFAFAYDGTQLWHNPDVKGYTTDGGGSAGWGGPAIGNLDLDPEPEIVIAASEDAVYVLDHEGNTLWSDPIGRWPTPPLLADISGDGVLDIVVGREWELDVIDFFNGGQIVWSYVQTDTINFLGGQGLFGAPAVADLNGDGRAEIVVNWGHLVEAIQDDGTLLWRYETGRTDLFRPSPITIADVTGDGQLNVVTASAVSAGLSVFEHLLMVLDANGNLVWEQLVGDNSASASGVAAQDLTGDGAWEILWNGAADGLLIIRGSDGKRLFNEPFTASGTAMEYPTLGDVDGDGVADVALGGYEGIFVISHVGRWADSRPIWNQHNYHVTNINDDWSVPISEPNSWELLNTYRTQTPDRSPTPAYQMVFTYTAGAPNVTVLTNTASISLTVDAPLYGWDYRQEWYQPLITTTFDSLLTSVAPGETRQVSAGTEIAYRLPSGFNYLTLPPLYVSAPRIAALTPESVTAFAGSTAVYTLTLTNPGSVTAVYTLTASGPAGGWLTLPPSVNVPAGSSVDVVLTAVIPPDAVEDTLPLFVDVAAAGGAQDTALAYLTVANGLALDISPAMQSGPTGQPLTYTLSLTNLETTERAYTLAFTGTASLNLPSVLTVPGGGQESVDFTAVPLTAGPQPFTIQATSDGGATASTTATAVGLAGFGVQLALLPDAAAGGRGGVLTYTLAISNVGALADSYALDVTVPAGWTAVLQANGTAVDELSLLAGAFNRGELLLVVGPDAAATPGAYDVTVTAVSQSAPNLVAMTTGAAQVLNGGVQVAFSSGPGAVDLGAAASWTFLVTNTGDSADTFDLTPFGTLASLVQVSSTSIVLNPGQSQSVQLAVSEMAALLPGAHTLGLLAQSGTDENVLAVAETAVTLNELEAFTMAWQPSSRTVTDTLQVSLMLLITNTGNVLTEIDLGITIAGGLAQPQAAKVLVPAGGSAIVPVIARVTGPGDYEVLATAVSAGGLTQTVTAMLFVETTATTGLITYLPVVIRRP